MTIHQAHQTHQTQQAQQNRQTYLRRLWSGIRSFLYGFDAASAVRHGLPVPPDHPARRCATARRQQPPEGL